MHLYRYECDDGSQVIIATSEEVIAAAGCDISAFEGQVLEVLHEPGSGNIIVQANFTTTDNSLNDATLVELEGQSIDVTEESDPESSSDPYKCHICETTFNSKKTLNLHSTVHVDEAFYACEFCPASKIHWKEMWLHQCSNADSIPIVCPQCHKTVSTKKQLQVHEEVHELQRRFTSKRMDGYFQRKLQEAEDPVVDWGNAQLFYQIANFTLLLLKIPNFHFDILRCQTIYMWSMWETIFKVV